MGRVSGSAPNLRLTYFKIQLYLLVQREGEEVDFTLKLRGSLFYKCPKLPPKTTLPACFCSSGNFLFLCPPNQILDLARLVPGLPGKLGAAGWSAGKKMDNISFGSNLTG